LILTSLFSTQVKHERLGLAASRFAIAPYPASMPMVIHFLTVEVELQAAPTEMQRSIARELQKWGEPLRWAITAVDSDRRKAQIEAVVITPTEFLIPAVTTI
jgi:hypothetical protein